MRTWFFKLKFLVKFSKKQRNHVLKNIFYILIKIVKKQEKCHNRRFLIKTLIKHKLNNVKIVPKYYLQQIDVDFGKKVKKIRNFLIF